MPRALCALAMTGGKGVRWHTRVPPYKNFCRAGPMCPAGGAGKIRVGPSRTPTPTEAYLAVRRGGALPLPRATARAAPTEGYKQYRGRADVGIGPYGVFTDRIS